MAVFATPARSNAWRRRARAVAAGTALLLASLLAAGVPEPTPPEHGRLWRVSRPGVPDSFVLGTIHVADPRVARIAPPVAEALARSRTLALEAVPLPVSPDALDELELLADGGRLEPLIGAETYAEVRRALAAQGHDDATIARLKPWAAMLKAAPIAGPDAGRSLDESLFVAALDRRMRVEPMEGAADQAAAFDAVPVATQVALLVHVLAHRDELATMTEPVIAAWLRGDLPQLADLARRAGERFPDMRQHYDALGRHVIANRTAVFHYRLFLALRAGRVFVAVGASHLSGDAGLLALLRGDGYRVTPVW